MCEREIKKKTVALKIVWVRKEKKRKREKTEEENQQEKKKKKRKKLARKRYKGESQM